MMAVHLYEAGFKRFILQHRVADSHGFCERRTLRPGSWS
jgi:hypothetical protein